MKRVPSFFIYFLWSCLGLALIHIPARSWIKHELKLQYKKKLTPVIEETYKVLLPIVAKPSLNLTFKLEEKGKHIFSTHQAIHFLLHYDRNLNLMFSQIRSIKSRQVLKHIVRLVKDEVAAEKRFFSIKAGDYLVAVLPSSTSIESPHGYMVMGFSEPRYFLSLNSATRILIGVSIATMVILAIILFFSEKKLKQTENPPDPKNSLSDLKLKKTETTKDKLQEKLFDKPKGVGFSNFSDTFRTYGKETISSKILFPKEDSHKKLQALKANQTIRSFQEVYKDQQLLEKKAQEEKFKRALEKACDGSESVPQYLAQALKAIKEIIDSHRTYLYWAQPQEPRFLENTIEMDGDQVKHYFPGHQAPDDPILLDVGSEGKTLMRGEASSGENEIYSYIIAPLFRNDQIRGAIRLERDLPSRYQKTDERILARLGKRLMEYLPKRNLKAS